jgi:beta-lactam-binding protein with PASTA domain
MEQQPIKIPDMTDLQLADAVIQLQTQGMQLQQAMMEISAEIKRRKQL